MLLPVLRISVLEQLHQGSWVETACYLFEQRCATYGSVNSEILHDQLYLPCFRHFVELPSFCVFISGLSNLLSGSNNIAS